METRVSCEMRQLPPRGRSCYGFRTRLTFRR
jgi:hypothetical protein